MKFDPIGVSLCARYAYAPNSLHFCGPEKQVDLHAYVSQDVTDTGLPDILRKFETLYPYLQLIAGENGIKDPLDTRVVEAYWVGNGLLAKARFRPYQRLLEDEFSLVKKLPKKRLSQTLSVLDSAFPHHSFHVLTIFCRTGHASLPHTIETMDNCRIGWGTIYNNTQITIPNKQSNTNNSYSYKIKTRRLYIKENKIALSEPVVTDAIGLTDTYNPGEVVSLHWGYICDKLSQRQQKNLARYTKLAIDLANRERIVV